MAMTFQQCMWILWYQEERRSLWRLLTEQQRLQVEAALDDFEDTNTQLGAPGCVGVRDDMIVAMPAHVRPAVAYMFRARDRPPPGYCVGLGPDASRWVPVPTPQEAMRALLSGKGAFAVYPLPMSVRRACKRLEGTTAGLHTLRVQAAGRGQAANERGRGIGGSPHLRDEEGEEMSSLVGAGAMEGSARPERMAAADLFGGVEQAIADEAAMEKEAEMRREIERAAAEQRRLQEHIRIEEEEMRRTVGQQERRPRPDKHLPLRGGPSDDDFRMSSGGVGYVAAESKHGKERFGDSFATWEKPCRLAQRGEGIPDAYRTKAIQIWRTGPLRRHGSRPSTRRQVNWRARWWRSRATGSAPRPRAGES